MRSLKGKFARKAAKSTAKHSAYSAAAKLKRRPIRAGTLFGLGCAVGVAADRLLGRRASPTAD